MLWWALVNLGEKETQYSWNKNHGQNCRSTLLWCREGRAQCWSKFYRRLKHPQASWMKTCTTKGLNIKRTCVFSYSLWWACFAYFMAVDFISMPTFLLICAEPLFYISIKVFFSCRFDLECGSNCCSLLWQGVTLTSGSLHPVCGSSPKMKSGDKNTFVFLDIKASRWPMVPARPLKEMEDNQKDKCDGHPVWGTRWMRNGASVLWSLWPGSSKLLLDSGPPFSVRAPQTKALFIIK